MSYTAAGHVGEVTVDATVQARTFSGKKSGDMFFFPLRILT